MTVALDQSRTRRNPALALSFAARELRGGLRGFYVFIACIALGVMAIAGIGSWRTGADGSRAKAASSRATWRCPEPAWQARRSAFLADRGRISLPRSPRGRRRSAARPRIAPDCAPWRALMTGAARWSR
jgi:putative ABC transport system permease protein